MELYADTAPKLSSNKITDDALEAKKRQIRALKRVLIAKAEVRRLKSLVGRKRVAGR